MSDIVEVIENTDCTVLTGKVNQFLENVCNFSYFVNFKMKKAFYNLQEERDNLIATFYDFDVRNKKEKIRCFRVENKIRALFDELEYQFEEAQHLKNRLNFCTLKLFNTPLNCTVIIEKYIKPLISFLILEYQLIGIKVKLDFIEKGLLIK